MANYEATRYDWDGAYLTGVQGVNTGIIIPWGSASLPSGFLECNGQAVSQATYAALFAVIGVTYGDPGGGNFNVPDLRDRVSVSKSNNKTITTTGGANTVTPSGNASLTAAQTALTTAQLPAHSHSYNVGVSTAMSTANMSSSVGSSPQTTGSAGGGQGHNHSISSVTFTGNAQSVLQPYLTLIYIIKT